MYRSLLIAAGKQKKLLIIFLITVFLPAVSLAVFGIIALNNEQFRFEKQLEEKQQQTVEYLQTKIIHAFKEAGNYLWQLSRTEPVVLNNKPEIYLLLDKCLEENPLLDQFFILHNEEEPWFHHFRMDKKSFYPGYPITTTALENQIKRAEEYEFVLADYQQAITVYENAFNNTNNKNEQGKILNCLARNHLKLNRYESAAAVYLKIIDDYPQIKIMGIPIGIAAHLQLIDCYRNLNANKKALEQAFETFQVLIQNYDKLTENQLKTYVTLVNEQFQNVSKDINSADKDYYINQFHNLNTTYKKLLLRWQTVNELKNNFLEGAKRDLFNNDFRTPKIYRFTERINDESMLILITAIPDSIHREAVGIFGVTINKHYFCNHLLHELIQKDDFKDFSISIQNFNGRQIYGNSGIAADALVTTAFFEENFPPWRIQIAALEHEKQLFRGIFRSFYFWTILTTILILVFGVFLIIRTLIHEMEVLKMKAEFVSSVSHEFKTPITSIKALTERLLDGKIESPQRMKDYYSVIYEDTENLSRLVSNFLDFAKMEEGKKQYEFVKTDLQQWVPQIIMKLTKDFQHERPKINLKMEKELPIVAIDRNTIELALNNLIDNGFKFSENADVDVKIGQDKKDVFIQVKDYGKGISVKEQDKIFDKFYQGKNAADYSATGSGLGLALVKRIAEAHGGTVHVNSETGKGSTFTLVLPV